MRAKSIAGLGWGAYVAGICTTLLVLTASTLWTEGTVAAPLVIASIAVLLGAGASFAVVAALDRNWLDLQRFRHTRSAALLVAPLVVCAFASVGTPTGWRGSAIGAALVAFAGWSGIVRSAETQYAERALEGDVERLGSLPDVDGRTSNRLQILNGAFGVLMLVFAVVGFALGERHWYVYLGIAAAPLAIAFESTRAVTVTDRGLLFDSRFGAKLLEWSTFGGYYLGDDLLLLRSKPWRRDLRFELDAVDERALDAIDRHLPQAMSPGIPAGGLEVDRGQDDTSGSADRTPE